MSQGRTTPMTKSDVRSRADHARGLLAAIDLISDFGVDADITAMTNVVGSLAVLAGSAASDAICGLALGERAAGEGHVEAVALLKTATVSGTDYARNLRRLLDVKTTTQYSANLLGERQAEDLVKYAQRLVEGMEREIRR